MRKQRPRIGVFPRASACTEEKLRGKSVRVLMMAIRRPTRVEMTLGPLDLCHVFFSLSFMTPPDAFVFSG